MNLTKYLAAARALYLLHQNNHWTCSGDNFYGNHLLFERLYKTAQETTDAMAEKILGVFPDTSLDLQEQMSLMSQFVSSFEDKDPLKNSLAAEKLFIKLLDEAYVELEKSEEMTMGLDDLLMSLSNNHEENCYLLQQSLKNNSSKVSKLANRLAARRNKF